MIIVWLAVFRETGYVHAVFSSRLAAMKFVARHSGYLVINRQVHSGQPNGE